MTPQTLHAQTKTDVQMAVNFRPARLTRLNLTLISAGILRRFFEKLGRFSWLAFTLVFSWESSRIAEDSCGCPNRSTVATIDVSSRTFCLFCFLELASCCRRPRQVKVRFRILGMGIGPDVPCGFLEILWMGRIINPTM